MTPLVYGLIIANQIEMSTIILKKESPRFAGASPEDGHHSIRLHHPGHYTGAHHETLLAGDGERAGQREFPNLGSRATGAFRTRGHADFLREAEAPN